MIFSPNYVLHDPSLVREVHGREGVEQYAATFRAASPDVPFAVEDQIAEGDIMVTCWTARGTHRERFLGIFATGEQMKVTSIEFDRVVYGKIDEVWVGYHLSADRPLDNDRDFALRPTSGLCDRVVVALHRNRGLRSTLGCWDPCCCRAC